MTEFSDSWAIREAANQYPYYDSYLIVRDNFGNRIDVGMGIKLDPENKSIWHFEKRVPIMQVWDDYCKNTFGTHQPPTNLYRNDRKEIS